MKNIDPINANASPVLECALRKSLSIHIYICVFILEELPVSHIEIIALNDLITLNNQLPAFFSFPDVLCKRFQY